jgi:agmatinase
MALTQMTAGYAELLSRMTKSSSSGRYFNYPKLITLGGDHSLALPALRALSALHGEPIAVLHFDSHLGKHFSSVDALVTTPFDLLCSC